ncbi:MAG: ribosome silencing factor [Chlamydiia bacterium]|nr:ribosome silencing factor [Chlamydiia bacterium]
MTDKRENSVREIAQTLFDKKGSNIIAIDVKGISSITDYVIIADGNVDRHVIALAKEVEDIMRDAGEKPAHVEGMQNGDWIVLDYFQVVIHLFVPEMREKYQLERLWPDGKVIDLSLQEKRIAE